MGNKLYIGNLSYDIDSQQLGELFGQVGAVSSANVIMDRDSGRSKGFGFVEMSAEADARKAIEQLNGREVSGRALNVSEARPQEPRSGGGFGGRGGSGGGRSRY